VSLPNKEMAEILNKYNVDFIKLTWQDQFNLLAKEITELRGEVDRLQRLIPRDS
jgi:hypothetical protein